jgi:hypothetical protein
MGDILLTTTDYLYRFVEETKILITIMIMIITGHSSVITEKLIGPRI